MSDDSHRRIEAAIRRTLELLAEASSAKPEDTAGLEMVLWKVTAEAEYAAFRMSMASSLADYRVRIRLPNPPVLINEDLTEARRLIAGSANDVETSPKKAYEGLRAGIALLRRAQSRLLLLKIGQTRPPSK